MSTGSMDTRRVRLPGVLLIALIAVAVVAAMYERDPTTPPPPRAPVNVLAPPAPTPIAFGWKLTRAMSAHRAVVLEVDTTRPAEAMMIAQQLTKLYDDRCDEVLVYFFEPEVTPRRATVRVQWTRAHGYRTLVLRASP